MTPNGDAIWYSEIDNYDYNQSNILMALLSI